MSVSLKSTMDSVYLSKKKTTASVAPPPLEEPGWKERLPKTKQVDEDLFGDEDYGEENPPATPIEPRDDNDDDIDTRPPPPHNYKMHNYKPHNGISMIPVKSSAKKSRKKIKIELLRILHAPKSPRTFTKAEVADKSVVIKYSDVYRLWVRYNFFNPNWSSEQFLLAVKTVKPPAKKKKKNGKANDEEEAGEEEEEEEGEEGEEGDDAGDDKKPPEISFGLMTPEREHDLLNSRRLHVATKNRSKEANQFSTAIGRIEAVNFYHNRLPCVPDLKNEGFVSDHVAQYWGKEAGLFKRPEDFYQVNEFGFDEISPYMPTDILNRQNTAEQVEQLAADGLVNEDGEDEASEAAAQQQPVVPKAPAKKTARPKAAARTKAITNEVVTEIVTDVEAQIRQNETSMQLDNEPLQDVPPPDKPKKSVKRPAKATAQAVVAATPTKPAKPKPAPAKRSGGGEKRKAPQQAEPEAEPQQAPKRVATTTAPAPSTSGEKNGKKANPGASSKRKETPGFRVTGANTGVAEEYAKIASKSEKNKEIIEQGREHFIELLTEEHPFSAWFTVLEARLRKAEEQIDTLNLVAMLVELTYKRFGLTELRFGLVDSKRSGTKNPFNRIAADAEIYPLMHEFSEIRRSLIEAGAESCTLYKFVERCVRADVYISDPLVAVLATADVKLAIDNLAEYKLFLNNPKPGTHVRQLIYAAWSFMQEVYAKEDRPTGQEEAADEEPDEEEDPFLI